MKKLLITIAAFSALAAAPAFAGDRYQTVRDTSKFIPAPLERQTSGGLYVAIFGGVNVGQTADIEDVSGGSFIGTIGTELDSEIGWFGGVKLGFLCPVPGRVKPAVELEGMYNGLNAKFETSSRIGDVDFGADLHTASFMVNVKAQIEFGRFQPYIGAGLGYAHTWVDQVEVDGTEIRGAESDEGTFAYQGFAGFDIQVNERLAIFTEYKALVLHDLGDVKNFVNHLVGAGVRIGF